jgi:hypothetical protein
LSVTVGGDGRDLEVEHHGFKVLPSGDEVKQHNFKALSQRGGASLCKRWWTKGSRDPNFSSMNAESNQNTQALPLRKLRQRLSLSTFARFERGDSSGSGRSPVFSIPVARQNGQAIQTVPPAKRHEHLRNVSLSSDETGDSSMTVSDRSLLNLALAQKISDKAQTSNKSQCSSSRRPLAENLWVPYIFEFVPFPGHTCMGRGTIPLGNVAVSVDSRSGPLSSFRYNSSFQRLLNRYNHQSHLFLRDPLELRHVTQVTLRNRVEFSASVLIVRAMRERKVLVVTLLKSYPDCQQCKERGRLLNNTVA